MMKGMRWPILSFLWLFLLLTMNFARQITMVQLGYNYMHIFSAKDTEALFVSFILFSPKSNC